MHNFADRMRKMRKSYGLSQEKFAKRLGISRDYLSQLENGREPGIRVRKILELYERAELGVPPSEEAVREEGEYPSSEARGKTEADARAVRRACEAHLREYLDAAENVPHALNHALLQLKIHLPVRQLDRLPRSGEEE